MNPADLRGQAGAARQGTVLESVEEIRAQIRGAAAIGSVPAPASRAAADSLAASGETAHDEKPFRPTVRPPMASLCVLDDGDDSGEIVRIRASSFVIGRADGNLVIAHDSGISSRHAEISRRLEKGEYVWFLKDLASTNGTFVRVSTVILGQGQEVLIGSRLYRMELPAPPLAHVGAPAAPADATRKWEVVRNDPSVVAPPTLVEVIVGSAGRSFTLHGQEYWLGRDARACTIVTDDPLANRRHARLYRDDRNRWIMASTGTRNGLWARVNEVALGRGAYFQCGEQRFFFKIL
jgi:pSer/pThr/pTyr-binding forkhead associated (FHA) protein